MQAKPVGIGLVGFGYWGPNLARNFSAQTGCRLAAICEISENRAALASRQYPQARVVLDYAAMLAMDDVDAVAVATPISTHYPLVKAALAAGKDVLVEKPITETAAQAQELVALAKDKGLILGVDHTFLYTGAVRKIKNIVDSGELGELYYIDSVRVNLGLFQQDANVLADLAPHDLSIMVHLIGQDPLSVRAMGTRHVAGQLENVVYMHVEYPGQLTAHFHFSWLAPVKVRKTIIAGSNKMIVYDDLEQSEKVKIYDKGICCAVDKETLYRIKVDYRTGDVLSPKLDQREALSLEAEHFAACVANRGQCVSDGALGLKIVRLLEAAQESLAGDGKKVPLA